jgi:hypothetical protein
MSLHEYRYSQLEAIRNAPFYALIMAAMRGADTFNAVRLRAAFPSVWEELQERYNAPCGFIKGDAAQVGIDPDEED